jgi:hypothetical protein
MGTAWSVVALDIAATATTGYVVFGADRGQTHVHVAHNINPFTQVVRSSSLTMHEYSGALNHLALLESGALSKSSGSRLQRSFCMH